MTANLRRTHTTVNAYGGMQPTIQPGQPWPGVYRGSRYSLSGDTTEPTLAVKHKGIEVQGIVPDGIVDALVDINKSGGTGLGSFRVTADNHVLTKVHADYYPHVEDAPVDDGWIAVYLGTLDGIIEFPGFNPDPADNPLLWTGPCFSHGERWTITANGDLEWRRRKGQPFNFESQNSYPQLTSAYKRVRNTGGRLRLNESGHLWMEAPRETLQQYEDLYDAIRKWLVKQDEEGNTRLLTLIHRRLKRTGGGDPKVGNFPLYVGHISEFDNGEVPVPQIDDPMYYDVDSQNDDSVE